MNSSMEKSFFIMNQNPGVTKEKVSKIEHIKITKNLCNLDVSHALFKTHTHTICQKILVMYQKQKQGQFQEPIKNSSRLSKDR